MLVTLSGASIFTNIQLLLGLYDLAGVAIITLRFLMLWRYFHKDISWMHQLDLPVYPAWVLRVTILFPQVQRICPMDIIAVPRHVIFAEPLSTKSTENKPFSKRIHERLRYGTLKLKVVIDLPQWSVIEGTLGVVTISKGNVSERHQPFLCVGSRDLVFP